jgi:hypothetical protein
LQGCRDTPRARVTVFAQDGSGATSRTTFDWTRKTLPSFAADSVHIRKIPQIVSVSSQWGSGIATPRNRNRSLS